MPVTGEERWESRRGEFGKDRRAPELSFIVSGSDQDQAIRNWAIANLPATYAGAVLQSYRLERLADQIWDVVAQYGSRERKEVGDSTYSFEIGGGTQKITQSISQTGYAPPGKTAPDMKGAIGVSKDSVEGVEVPLPSYAWSETHYFDVDQVTLAYQLAMANLVGRTNQAQFRGFAAKSVRFKGAQGSQRQVDDVEISFHFEFSPNVTGLNIAGITVATKNGWDYLWAFYVDDVDQNTLIKKPSAIYVDKVAHEGDFSLLGI